MRVRAHVPPRARRRPPGRLRPAVTARAGGWALVAVAALAAAAPAEAHRGARGGTHAAARAGAGTARHRGGPEAHAAVIDGGLAQAGTWPWVAFVADSADASACSGFVVSPTVVLTAAHCAEDIASGAVRPASAFRVVTGALDWSARGAQAASVTAVAVDPGFDRATLADDVAALVLSAPTSAPALPLATAAQTSLLTAGTPVAVAGWGSTYASQASPPTALHWGATVLQGQTFCANEEYIDGVPFDPANALCALDAPSLAIATCHGDSGGPLVAADASGAPVAVGVTSRGDPLCNPDFPSVFTRADSISAWVAGVIAANPVPSARPATPPPAAVPPPVVPATANRPARAGDVPAAGAYLAQAARGARVTVAVAAGARAGATVTLRVALACPAPRLHRLEIAVAPATGTRAGRAWRFSAHGVSGRRLRYWVSGSFRAPSTIAGTFRVSALHGRCTTGAVAWSAHAAAASAGARAFTELHGLDIRSTLANNTPPARIPVAEVHSTTEDEDVAPQPH